MIDVSPDIVQIKAYVPGKPIEELERELGLSGSIKLASNENPLGPPQSALVAIRSQLKQIGRYPNGGGIHLKNALADKWQVSPEQVMLGNGSNEIIELLVRTFLLPGDEVVMASPSFSLYDLMVQSVHGKIIRIPLRNDQHDLEAMTKAVTEKTKLIFICNPNNPTGTIVHHEAVKTFLSTLPNHVLVIFDEAYAEYVTDPAYPLSLTFLSEGAQIIMLRTFSKIYGLAGLRIGYGISHPELIAYMNRVRQPFNTSLPAQAGALAALTDEPHFERSLHVNQEGMLYLTRQFENMGIHYTPTQANFIYFKVSKHTPEIGAKIQRALLEQGVIIRHFPSGELRVSIGLQKENRRFIRSLKKTLSLLKETSSLESGRT